MGLQKSLELETGVSGNYWKITRMNADYINNTIGVQLSLYKDKATRDANKSPMNNNDYKIVLETDSDVTREAVYTKLKDIVTKTTTEVVDGEDVVTEEKFFSDATDV